MLRLVLLASTLTGLSGLSGCLFFDGRDGSSSGGGADAGTIDPSQCEPHTATIFEPADGATVPTTFTTRVRWNEATVPDRYTSMADDFGNFFIPTGQQEILGDGSITTPYTLPAGGRFTFEIGWICDGGNGGPSVPLATVHIRTAP